MDDDDLRALVEQAHQLDELSRHPGWAVLTDFWNVATRGNKLAVLNGNITDFDRYKTITGELVGIQKVIDTALTVQNMVDTERAQRAERDAE